MRPGSQRRSRPRPIGSRGSRYVPRPSGALFVATTSSIASNHRAARAPRWLGCCVEGAAGTTPNVVVVLESGFQLDRLERLEKQRELLQHTAHLVAGGLPVPELLTQLSELMARFAEASCAWVALVVEDPEHLEFVYGDRPREPDAALLSILRAGAARPYPNADPNLTPRVVVPMIFGGTAIGLLGVESSAAAGIESEDVWLFEALATYLGARLSDTRNAELVQVAATDALTGLANRRAFDEALLREWRRCDRTGTSLGLAMLDIDFFKRYNDAYGHVAGDGCLQKVAAAIAGCIKRPGDVVARYGGEEFVFVLPGSDAPGAIGMGEAICAAVRARGLAHEGSSLGYATVSIGVAAVVPTQGVDPQSLVTAADARLYEAKEAGRNRTAGEGYLSDAPVAKPRLLVRHNLPRYRSSSVGLDAITADVTSLLRSEPVVTVVGPGGIGKTRLAVQVANGMLNEYEDGAWFVDLAPVQDPARVAGAIAAVFGIGDDGDARPPIERVAAALKGKNLLLVLDNCEQVVLGAAEAVQRLSLLGPAVGVIATSRESLGVAGERCYRMPLLRLPPEGIEPSAADAMDYGAIALFAARARASRSSFVLTDSNAGIVADIVRRLDGIALAIELAAARIKVWSPRRLRESLDALFDARDVGSLGATERHQTLATLIGWSYDLLDAEERTLFRRLAVFRGSWHVDAAEAIDVDARASGSDVRDVLLSLASKSLIVPEPVGDAERYRFLESTREFALERLQDVGERGLAADRHVRYFVKLGSELDEAFWLSDFDAWAARVTLDLENFRSAIAWGMQSDRDVAASAAIVAALRNLWYRNARREGRELLEAASIALDEATTPVRARLTLAAALLTLDGSKAEHSLRDALQVFDEAQDLSAQAEALARLTWAVGQAGRLDDAVALFERALSAARATGKPRQIVSVLSQAYWLGLAGDAGRARSCFDEAASLLRECKDRGRLAILQSNRAQVLFDDDDLDGALAAAREAVLLYRERVHESGLCNTLNNTAAYQLAAGAHAQAWEAAREALEIASRLGDVAQSLWAIGHLAHLAAVSGALERAVELVAYVDATLSSVAMTREPAEQRGCDAAMNLARTALLESDIVRLRAKGASMSADAALAEAMRVAKPPARRPG